MTQLFGARTATRTEEPASSSGTQRPQPTPFTFNFGNPGFDPPGSGKVPPTDGKKQGGDPQGNGPGDDGGGDDNDDDPDPDDNAIDPEEAIKAMMQGLKNRGGSSSGGKEAESVKLKPLPSAVGFRAWRNHVRSAVVSASKDPQKSFIWILEVEREDATWNSMKYETGNHETLGTKLATAVTSIARGDLGTKISLCNEEGANRGEMVSGRQLLWLVYQSYKLSQTSGALYSLVDLTTLKIKNEKGQKDDAPHSDKQLRWFVSSWDGLIAGMKTVPTEDILEEIFLRKIRNVLSLKEDLAYYDRLAGGHADKSFTFLKEACNRLLERKREHENSHSLRRVICHTSVSDTSCSFCACH